MHDESSQAVLKLSRAIISRRFGCVMKVFVTEVILGFQSR